MRRLKKRIRRSGDSPICECRCIVLHFLCACFLFTFARVRCEHLTVESYLFEYITCVHIAVSFYICVLTAFTIQFVTSTLCNASHAGTRACADIACIQTLHCFLGGLAHKRIFCSADSDWQTLTSWVATKRLPVKTWPLFIVQDTAVSSA